MPAFSLSKRRFTPSLWMTLATISFLAFFIWLGWWQLQRAEEKKIMLATAAQQAKQPPLIWRPGMVYPKQYQTMVLEGKPLTQILLLDNQHYQHQFGFHVLTPLLMTSGSLVLIDRGWIAGDSTRRQFPVVSLMSSEGQSIQLSGQAYYPSDKLWVLGQVIEPISKKLAIIEKIDTTLISQFLHKSVYPFIIREEKDNSDGFVRKWPVVSMPPERHKAYAFQWFAMAFVILLVFVGLNFKTIDENSET